MRAGLITPSSNPETFEIIINYLVNDDTLSIVNIEFKSMTEQISWALNVEELLSQHILKVDGASLGLLFYSVYSKWPS